MNYEFLFHNLRNIREENDLTQKDMADILNVSRPNYTRWETKAKIIPLKKLNQFCNYFNISMDYVIGLSNDNTKYNLNNELDYNTIAKRIKDIRKNNNITQVQLANLLNTNQSVVSAYESGKTLILTSFAIEICMKLHVSMDWLCGRK